MTDNIIRVDIPLNLTISLEVDVQTLQVTVGKVSVNVLQGEHKTETTTVNRDGLCEHIFQFGHRAGQRCPRTRMGAQSYCRYCAQLYLTNISIDQLFAIADEVDVCDAAHVVVPGTAENTIKASVFDVDNRVIWDRTNNVLCQYRNEKLAVLQFTASGNWLEFSPERVTMLRNQGLIPTSTSESLALAKEMRITISCPPSE